MERSALRDTWEIYTGSWSEKDGAQRQQIFAKVLHPECEYSDANIHVEGHDGLSDYMSEFQKNVPGARFVTTSFIEHHGRTLAHAAVVRHLTTAGEAVAEGASSARADIAIGSDWQRDHLKVVAFVQERRGRAILAAASARVQDAAR